MRNFDILALVQQRPTIRVVDVGAMKIGPDPYEALSKSGIAEVVGFEPVESECAKRNAEAIPGHTFLPYFVGDGRKRTFHLCNWSMTSSLYEPNTALLDKFQNLENLTQVVKKEEVETHRLDDLQQVQDVDFLKLDVQGAELDVMRGAARVLSEAVVVQTEVEFVPMYKDQPLFAEVDQHLRGAGFMFHRFAGLAGRTFKPLIINNDINRPGSQIIWAEAVYVRDFMALSKLPPEKILKLGVILHLVYGSIDLALQVFKAYDEQMKTNIADRYFNELVAPDPAPAGPSFFPSNAVPR